MNKAHLGRKCECGIGKLSPTNDNCEWWVKCEACNKFVFTYQPMPHQARFHADPAKFKMYAGGSNSMSSLNSSN